MSNSLKLNVNHIYEIDSDVLTGIDAIKKSKDSYHVLEKNTSFHVNILENNFHKKIYTIVVNGNIYTVSIKDEIDTLIENMGLSSKASHKEDEVKAPMPGLIIDVEITEGQKVKEGDPLLVLEAMKMESTFTSPKEGVVQHIFVKKGDTVDKGQVLVKIE